MAIRKRTFRRKRRTYKKRTYKMARPMRALRPKSDVHMFKRWVDGGSIAGNVAYLPFLGSITFQLNQLPNVAEFTSLFDQYAITKVVTKFWLKQDPGAQAAASSTYPRLYYARDLDTGTVPGTLSQLREYSTCRVVAFNPNRPITLVARPNTLALTYTSAIASNYTPKWKQWLDVADPATPHYAWQYGIDDLTNTAYRVTVEHIFYFKCKNTR